MSLAKTRFPAALAVGAMMSIASPVHASDHLDTPTVTADPAADIGDLYAWMSPDGHRLNLVLDIVGKQFSDKIQYVFHVDSGKRFGQTPSTTPIVCEFDAKAIAECWAGDSEHIAGDAGHEAGIASASGRLRVFAGLRNDPFFNNVRGTRSAYEVAKAALERGANFDAAACPPFGEALSGEILDHWRHTDGGPAKDFLAGWTTAALVVSIDRRMVSGGGPLLAVWATTNAMPATGDASGKGQPTLGSPLDRMGRTLTGNALLGPLDPEDVSSRRKEQYNRAARSEWPQFAADIQRTLGLYDGFDGICGNQWLADAHAEPKARYQKLAALLADDRLWIDTRAKACTHYFAVERQGAGAESLDCGGRTPNYDAIDVYRSLLANGTEKGVDDGVAQDEMKHSTTVFPFLAAP
jgi:hypothetical protein